MAGGGGLAADLHQRFLQGGIGGGGVGGYKYSVQLKEAKAQQAAALTAGLELAAWLQQQGLATPALERRLTEQELYALRWPDWLRQETEDGSPWLVALQALD